MRQKSERGAALLVAAFAVGLPLAGCSLLAATDDAALRRPIGDADGAMPPDPLPDGRVPDGGAACEGLPRCDGATLLTCEGGAPMEVTCALGCDDERAACVRPPPSNVAGWNWDKPNTDAVIEDDVVYDTSACDPFVDGGPRGVVRKQMGAPLFGPLPELCIVGLRSLHVAEGATLSVVGYRALAIIVTETARIDGEVDLSASERAAGPGGGWGGNDARSGAGAGARPGVAGERDLADWDSGGGGGGALCGRGGDGGDGQSADGGGGGEALSGDWLLVPLFGGSGGGAGAPHVSTGGFGGGGGGALQLSAGEAIVVTGVLRAGGGEGSGGLNALDWGAGGGAGSGGAVLLEAPSVEVSGAVLARGGGGGGASYFQVAGEDGAPGSAAGNAPAAGGAGAYGDGNGGAGSAHDDLKGADGDEGPDDDGANGGGGGGGAGCILVRAADASLDAATLNPRTAPGLRTRSLAAD